MYKAADRLTQAILDLEDGLWNIEEALDEGDFTEEEVSDLTKAKELARSSRDLSLVTLQVFSKRKRRK